MEDELIRACDLSKNYGKKEILKNINLTIRKAESIALTGHNGSGKSTLLRILARLTSTDSGMVTYNGKLKIHYIPEHFPKMNITAKQYVTHMGLIEGLDKTVLNTKIRQLFKMFFMESMQSTPMKYLSKGTLQKVAVIQALLSIPTVLLLDEPLSGQDMASQNVFISAMLELKSQGTAIVMSCHEKFLINRMSDSVYELRDGLLQQVGLSKDIYTEYDILIFDRAKSGFFDLPDITKEIKAIEHLKENRLKITVVTMKSNEVILHMLQNGWQLKEIYHELI